MASNSNSLPGSLVRITEGIEKDRLINCDKLVELIKQVQLTENDFIPFSFFSHPEGESYGRTVIYEGTNYSVYLMSWAQGDFTAGIRNTATLMTML